MGVVMEGGDVAVLVYHPGDVVEGGFVLVAHGMAKLICSGGQVAASVELARLFGTATRTYGCCCQVGRQIKRSLRALAQRIN